MLLRSGTGLSFRYYQWMKWTGSLLLGLGLVAIISWGAMAGAASAPAAASIPQEAPTSSPLGDTLTLQETVELARHRAPAVAAAELDRQAAVFESTAVARNGGPDFAFASRALIAPKGFYDPALTNLGEYEAKLVLDWALSDGGIRGRARARAAFDLAAARLEAAIEARDVGLDVADLAANLLRLSELEASQREAVEWIDRLALLLRGAVRSGVRSTTDSVRIALERNSALATLEKTRLERRNAEIDLMAQLARGADSTLTIREPAIPERMPTPDDSIRVMASVARQPEIALARVAEERARIDVLEAKSANSSTLDLSLDAGLAGTDLTGAVPEDLLAEDPDATFEDRLRRDLGASASINFRAPVRGKTEKLRTQSRSIALRAAGVRSTGALFTQQNIALEILARWRSAYLQLQAAEAASVGAERNLLRAKSLYSGGAIQLLDLLDARRLYEDARERLAEARQESRIAQFRAEDRP